MQGLGAIGIIFTGLLGAALVTWAWWHFIGRGMAREKQRRDTLALTLSPTYRAKIEEDRRFRLAITNIALQRERLYLSGRKVTEEPNPALPTPLALPGPYDFLDVLATFVPALGAIFLGRTSQGNVSVPISRLWHIALAGATGGGKTNILRLILVQLLHLEATCYLADIHYAPNKRGMDWQPIAERLAAPPVRDVKDIHSLVDWLARRELQARIDREYRGEPIGTPLYLAIEELPAVMAEQPDIAAPLSKLLRQGRQYDLCLIGATQDMLVKTLGTSGGVRECFRTGYYTGGDMTTARVLLDLQKGQSIDEDGLGVAGRAYLKTVMSVAQEVRVPLASNDAVYALLGNTRGAAVFGNAYRNTEKPPDEWVESIVSLFPGAFPERNTPAQKLPAVSVSESERKQIVALASAGVSRRDILKRMRWGGEKYALIKAVLDEMEA